MQTIPPLSFKEIVFNFDAALIAADIADRQYERGDRPEPELAADLSTALDAANLAAEQVIAQPATTVEELKDKTRAILYRWRASVFDPSEIETEADWLAVYGLGVLPAFTDLVRDIEALAA